VVFPSPSGSGSARADRPERVPAFRSERQLPDVLFRSGVGAVKKEVRSHVEAFVEKFRILVGGCEGLRAVQLAEAEPKARLVWSALDPLSVGFQEHRAGGSAVLSHGRVQRSQRCSTPPMSRPSALSQRACSAPVRHQGRGSTMAASAAHASSRDRHPKEGEPCGDEGKAGSHGREWVDRRHSIFLRSCKKAKFW